MNDSLSLITLIKDASLLVQMVMVLLVVASFASWFVIAEKAREISQHFQVLHLVEEVIWSGGDMRTLFASLTGSDTDDSSNTVVLCGLESIFVAGFQEFRHVHEGASPADPEVLLENAARNMKVAVAREEDSLTARLSFLATVGSVSPYVGLFGTVWGIMNAFRSLANVSQVSLASVAPGISEALIATAMGLLAAIPAVIAYNRLSDRADRLLSQYDAFAESFITILDRRLR